MKTCIFAGPTLHGVAIAPEIERFGPAVMGSVFRAVESGYRRIGIVDGCFGDVPAVWHKEILFALSSGVEVYGASSMGALRAAEMHPYGMVGIGTIYRLYRSGRWVDDDEVAILHAPEYLAFSPLSEAMANVRFTLRALRHRARIDPQLEHALLRHMKSLHFSQRTRDALAGEAARMRGRACAVRLLRQFAAEYVDVKCSDARTLVAALHGQYARATPRPSWRFPATRHWVRQFEREIADVPGLR